MVVGWARAVGFGVVLWVAVDLGVGFGWIAVGFGMGCCGSWGEVGCGGRMVVHSVRLMGCGL